MVMLADLLKKFIDDNKTVRPRGDTYMEKPPEILENNGKAVDSHWNLKQFFGMNEPYSGTITKDDGSVSTDQSNPFLDAIQKSRANDDKGPGVLRQFLDSVMNPGLTPGTGTVGGGEGSQHVPGTGTDAALDQTPMKDQKQENLAPTGVPLPQERPASAPDYSQPSALDPQSIEELRTSLLTQAGQMDPNNPNGLSGRMNSPNAGPDMGQQQNQAMSIEDSIRGFDGVKSAKIKQRNANAQGR